MSSKVSKIVEIWSAGLGVVSLHCFQSVIPVEAYTREACMVDALGRFMLCVGHLCMWMFITLFGLTEKILHLASCLRKQW